MIAGSDRFTPTVSIREGQANVVSGFAQKASYAPISFSGAIARSVGSGTVAIYCGILRQINRSFHTLEHAHQRSDNLRLPFGRPLLRQTVFEFSMGHIHLPIWGFHDDTQATWLRNADKPFPAVANLSDDYETQFSYVAPGEFKCLRLIAANPYDCIPVESRTGRPLYSMRRAVAGSVCMARRPGM